MGERVNKIRFVGSINKATRVRKSVTLSDFGNIKKRTHVKEKRRGSAAISSSKPGKGGTNNSVILVSIVLMIN